MSLADSFTQLTREKKICAIFLGNNHHHCHHHHPHHREDRDEQLKEARSKMFKDWKKFQLTEFIPYEEPLLL